MPGEKQNSVRSKVISLQEIPAGFHFNKGGVWGQMRDRLPKRKRKAAYFLLAASVLFAMVVAGINYNSSSLLGIKIIAFKQPSIKTNPVAPVKVQTVAQKNRLTITSKNIRRPVLVAIKKEEEPIVSIENKIPEVDEKIATVIKDTVHTQPVIASVKRKYKVAHINELDDNKPVMPQTVEPRIAGIKKIFSADISEIEATTPQRIVTQKKKVFGAFASSYQ